MKTLIAKGDTPESVEIGTLIVGDCYVFDDEIHLITQTDKVCVHSWVIGSDKWSESAPWMEVTPVVAICAATL